MAVKGQELRFIKKRDGKLVSYDNNKVIDAIRKAQKACGEDDFELADEISRKVLGVLELLFKGDNAPTVENVQDLVEKFLMESGSTDVAKKYILYRHQREELRGAKSLFEGAVDLVDSYIKEEDWRVRENSNMSYSLQGLNNHISSKITTHYWLEKIYPSEVREAHSSGDIHIHDLGLLSVYCCGWDLFKLLEKGFCGVVGKVESKPAKHFKTALGQIVNFFYTMQGEAAGAQAFANFDTYLAPFIRYDKLSFVEVKQAMQEFIFNINVPTRVGFQTPFTNITMDLECPKSMQNLPVVCGGVFQEDTYGDFQEEMDMINRAFAEVMMDGDAKGRIFGFPIPTYNISVDFDYSNKNLDAVWEMTAKYGIPYFANFVNSDMDPDDARSMCCRLRLDNRELRKRGGGLFGANPLTGSIGVVTINMPRLGYLAQTEDEFFEKLKALMDISKESLEIKRDVLRKFTDEGLYPYSRVYLEDIKKSQGDYWINHFSTIGLVGMNEACLNLFNEDIYSEKGKDFTLRVLDFMREVIQNYQEETGNLFNLEATPAEGTSYRLARRDREMFGKDLITAGGEVPYYTNSTQLPVGKTDDIVDALNHQDAIQTKYTGGTVIHLFIGEKIDDVNTVKDMVKSISSGYEMPYFTLSPTFTICPVHGYVAGEHHDCPVSI